MPIDYAAIINSIPDVPADAPAESSAEQAQDVEGDHEQGEVEAPEHETEAAEPGDGEQDTAIETDAETAAEPEPEPEVTELSDSHRVRVNGERLTVKQLKEGFLRQQDYTKKTQAAAERVRTAEAERDSEREEKQEMVEWLQSLNDPDTFEFEFQRHLPQVWAEIQDRIIARAIEEQDMTETERALARRVRAAELKARSREADDKYAQTKAEKQARAQRTGELRQTFDGWLQSELAAAGLDPKNDDHQELVRSHIQNKMRGQKWTQAHFKAAAVAVAKLLGKATPGTPTPQDKAAKLPPGAKPAGHKAPTQTGAKAQVQKKAAGLTGIDKIKARYGLA